MASREALLRALLVCVALLAVAGALSGAAAASADASVTNAAGSSGGGEGAAAPAAPPSTLARVLKVTQGQLTSGLGTMFSVVRACGDAQRAATRLRYVERP
jgi:hypothetical protein